FKTVPHGEGGRDRKSLWKMLHRKAANWQLPCNLFVTSPAHSSTASSTMSTTLTTKGRPMASDQTVHQQRLAILGLGKMGSILMQAFRKQNVVQAENIQATVQHAERATTLSSKYGITVTTDNLAAV